MDLREIGGITLVVVEVEGVAAGEVAVEVMGLVVGEEVIGGMGTVEQVGVGVINVVSKGIWLEIVLVLVTAAVAAVEVVGVLLAVKLVT